MTQCKDMKTLNYKNIINNGKSMSSSNTSVTSMENLDIFLNKDIENNKKAKWSKLTKTEKIKKLKNYIDKNKTKYKVEEKEYNTQIKLLLKLVDKQKQNKQNDLNYNSDEGEIENIEDLNYDTIDKTFTIIRDKNITLKKQNKIKIDI